MTSNNFANYLNSEDGGNFLLTLSEAIPVEVMKIITSSDLFKADNKTLLNYKVGRRQLVWTLEKLVIHENLFYDAMQMLLKLAVNENESYANNATGIFTSMFSILLGGTQTPFKERVVILDEILKSENKKEVEISLKCYNNIFSKFQSRIIGSEFQGTDFYEPWKPKNWKEYYEIYSYMWEKFEKDINLIKFDDLKLDAYKTLLFNSRSALSFQYKKIENKVIDSIETIVGIQNIDKEIVYKTINNIIKYDLDNLSEENKERIETLKEKIFGDDLRSRIEKYIGMDNSIFYEEKSDGGFEDKSIDKIEEIAKDLLNNMKDFEENIEWLMSTKAKRNHILAKILSELDKENKLFDFIKEKQKNNLKNLNFLIFYLKPIFSNKSDKYLELMNKIYQDEILNKYYGFILSKAGINDDLITLFLKKVKNQEINYEDLSYLFFSDLENISIEIIEKITNLMLIINTEKSIYIAINIYYNYFYNNKNDIKFSKEILYKLITNSNIKKREIHNDNVIYEYRWKELIYQYIKINEEENDYIKIFKYFLDNIEKSDSFISNFIYESYQDKNILYELIKKIGNKSFDIIMEFLFNAVSNSKTYFIENWISGKFSSEDNRNHLFDYIDHDYIITWVEGNNKNETIIEFISSITPKDFFEKKKESFLYKFLLKYGTDEKIRYCTFNNFYYGIFWGSKKNRYSKLKENIENIEDEFDENEMKLWFSDFKNDLHEKINQAIREEEREF